MSKIYYHFTNDRLRDGTPIPPIGEWLVFPGTPKICYRGLHASDHPFDALQFAPGNILHKVELIGIEEKHTNKVVAKQRKIIATIDATDLLQSSARQFAVDVMDLWTPPGIVRDFLITGDKSKAPAAEAAAAEAAAGSAWPARAAGWAAAWAARAAAKPHLKDKQAEYFLRMVEEEFDKS